MMDQIMKVNDSIMKPTGELTLYLGEGKKNQQYKYRKKPSATQHIQFIRLCGNQLW